MMVMPGLDLMSATTLPAFMGIVSAKPRVQPGTIPPAQHDGAPTTRYSWMPETNRLASIGCAAVPQLRRLGRRLSTLSPRTAIPARIEPVAGSGTAVTTKE
jgi:hypothetical protein